MKNVYFIFCVVKAKKGGCKPLTFSIYLTTFAKGVKLLHLPTNF